MMDEPIARVEELKATLELNEEKLIEEGRRRVLQWIEWRTADYSIFISRINEMKEEEEWCLNWLGTSNVKKALDPKLLDQVRTQKYAYLNQKIDAKNKSTVDEATYVVTYVVADE